MTDEDAYHMAADAYMEGVQNMSLSPEKLVKYRSMADKSWQEQLTEAYADGRSDERLSTVLACIDIVAMHGGSVEIESAMRALLDSEHNFKHDTERLLCGAAPVTEGDVIALAVAHNLGRTMKPLGLQTGDVFVTDQSYRTGELLAFAAAVREPLRAALAGLLRIHTDPVNWSGKFGKELDGLLSEQQSKIDARVSAAKAALGIKPANDEAHRTL